MNKRQFIERLRASLNSIPHTEREEILKDYEEHFTNGEAEGKTEAEICVDLGIPEDIARQFTEQTQPPAAEKTMQSAGDPVHIRRRVLLIGAGLIGLHIMFLFWPLFTLFWVWCAAWVVTVVLVFVGIALAVVGIFNIAIPVIGFLTAPFFLFFGIGIAALGVVVWLLLSWLTSLTFKLLRWWYNLNVDFAKKLGGAYA